MTKVDWKAGFIACYCGKEIMIYLQFEWNEQEETFVHFPPVRFKCIQCGAEFLPKQISFYEPNSPALTLEWPLLGETKKVRV